MFKELKNKVLSPTSKKESVLDSDSSEDGENKQESELQNEKIIP